MNCCCGDSGSLGEVVGRRRGGGGRERDRETERQTERQSKRDREGKRVEREGGKRRKC